MPHRLENFYKKSKAPNRKGASIAEYSLLAGLVSVVAIVSVLRLGDETKSVFEGGKDSLETALGDGDVPDGGDPVSDPFSDVDDSEWLIGTPAADTLALSGEPGAKGLASADVMTGTHAAEGFIGGPGNDDMQGGYGDDYYMFARGDGSDLIFDEQGGSDEVRFVDISSAEVVLSPIGYDVVFTTSFGDVVRIDNQRYKYATNYIETIKFTDVTWDHQAMRNRLVHDQKPTGEVFGSSWQEQYRHAEGEGSYTVAEYTELAASSGPYKEDSFEFTDLASSQVTFGRDGDDATATTAGGDVITFRDFNNRYRNQDIETVIFTDQTLDLQAFRDRVASDQKPTGVVLGTWFDENYKHADGDGSYSISDYSTLNSSYDDDNIEFTDLQSSQVTFGRSGDDATIATPGGDLVTLKNFSNRYDYYEIETITFTDQTLERQSIRDRVVLDQKPTGVVLGTPYTENYFHDNGDGSYSITDYSTLSLTWDNDKLTFTGLASTDVTIKSLGDDMLIESSVNGEVIKIVEAFDSLGRNQIEQYVFTDTVLTHQDMDDRAIPATYDHI